METVIFEEKTCFISESSSDECLFRWIWRLYVKLDTTNLVLTNVELQWDTIDIDINFSFEHNGYWWLHEVLCAKRLLVEQIIEWITISGKTCRWYIEAYWRDKVNSHRRVDQSAKIVQWNVHNVHWLLSPPRYGGKRAIRLTLRRWRMMANLILVWDVLCNDD